MPKSKAPAGKPDLAFFEGSGKSRVAVYPYLNRTRPAGPHNPEEEVRLATYNDLLTRYKYPAALIDIEFPVLIREDESPRFADIVVFSDVDHKRPVIVVETKKPKQQEGERQGQRYATILRAVYALWTNGTDSSATVLVNRYPEEAEPISDIPDFEGSPKYRIDKLICFNDDKQVTDSFRECHNLIRNLSHLKPDDAFTEFLKILLVKLQDETRASEYEFQIIYRGEPPKEETVNETAQRIRLLFKLAVEEDADVAAAFDAGDDIALTNDCIAQIVRKLQRFTFAETSVDQKGRAFETFLSGDMRQEFKEFMTPRPVVEAIVDMANPDRTMNILDPCCGSGAFLIYSLKKVRAAIEAQIAAPRQQIKLAFDYAHDKLWGFDTSKQMTAVARINMLVNEDGRAHIFKFDSLAPKSKAPEPAKGRSFQLIVTNPPFGKRIAAPSVVLQHFGLAKDDKNQVKKGGSYLTEILFLERNLEWLAPDGRLFIVLPDSVLGNNTLGSARRFIEQRAKIIGVVSLSSDTFGPSGAKSKTSVLILQKRREVAPPGIHDNHPIFVAHVEHVGYDFTGRATGKNDLPELVAEFRRFSSSKPLKSKFAKTIPRTALGDYWVAQPHLGEAVESSASGETKLKEVCSRIFCGKTAPRKDYTKEGFHLVKVGNLTGRGIEFNAVERQYVSGEFADRYSRAALEHGDILLTAAAHGPKWIGLKVDIFEEPPAAVPSPVLACGEVMVIRVDPESGVDPHALLLFLRSAAGYDAIQNCIRGQSGHIYPEDIGSIPLPNFKALSAGLLREGVAAIKASLKSRREACDASDRAAAAAAKLFPSARHKPVIAL